MSTRFSKSLYSISLKQFCLGLHQHYHTKALIEQRSRHAKVLKDIDSPDWTGGLRRAVLLQKTDKMYPSTIKQ